ncbi:uncharacterized protein AC631_05030 [Debaryomyces fabryi]|uniref:Shugoshin N-terminal coiled-coil domain-containing protein n=1 Tax=Debaryomyces fabryi TaxID=58627 RepID=A0A0V1PSS8_9ASCO|nr:uncharacterized protein AC631_05030 [Debaryomyces fabryi]KRZ99215.1 hypothetical protein AC631_05030 [Debaryomyces fabryi]CUM52470.1 unnamed protein product [Debaryomyces fabryi]
MARPSVSSQSLADLASSKFQSKKENKNDDNDPVASSFLDDEITQEPIKNKGLKNKQEQHKNIELIRKKYTLQNKSLAKNNSLMMLRISEMEAKVSDLINENMLLRKRRTFKDAELKKQLEAKLEIVETGLVHKFGEIFEMLREIRMDEGMAENPQLGIFKNLLNEAPSATSTPIEDASGTGISPFVFNPRSLSQPLKESSFTLPKSHLYLHTADKVTKLSVILKGSVEKKENANAYVSNEDNIDLLKNDSVSEVSEVQSRKPCSESSLEIMPNSEAKEASIQSPESIKNIQNIPVHNKRVNSHESRMFDVYTDKDKESDVIDILDNTVNSKSSKKTKKTAQKEPVVSKADPQIKQEKNQEEPQEESRRPSRSRKPVSYKWPSLSKKMRRQSEKFVDAVIVPDEEEPTSELAKVSVLDSPIKQEPESQTERKRSKSNDISDKSSKRSKRQPLGNVTHINNNKTNSKNVTTADKNDKAHITKIPQTTDDENDKVVKSKMDVAQRERDEKNDPSIFDFDEVNIAPKTYKKRKQSTTKGERRTYESRRHSMLI